MTLTCINSQQQIVAWHVLFDHLFFFKSVDIQRTRKHVRNKSLVLLWEMYEHLLIILSLF